MQSWRQLKLLCAFIASSLFWMIFPDVCSVFTLLLSFPISSSALFSSPAKHFHSSTRATYSFVLLSALFLVSFHTLFNISTCLLQDSHWFPALTSNLFLLRVFSCNYWPSSFNCPSSSLAVAYLAKLLFNFSMQLIQLHHTDWSSVQVTGGLKVHQWYHIFFYFIPTIQ